MEKRTLNPYRLTPLIRKIKGCLCDHKKRLISRENDSGVLVDKEKEAEGKSERNIVRVFRGKKGIIIYERNKNGRERRQK